MDAQEVHRKVQTAIAAIEEYYRDRQRGHRTPWDDDIKKGLEDLIEKRHMLHSSGQTCPRCGGSGRV
jgi:hypothetical protein